MLPNDIVITDDDIAKGEILTLGPGLHFNHEQIAFMKDVTTLDLQAVPGSGKTTALTGKLVAMSRMLPFDDGSGILVISHTNGAIDSFRRKISTHCPQLFCFPNFVGTIQSFADRFLAIPYFRARYGGSPYRIDDDTYNSRVYEPQQGSLQGWLSHQDASARRKIVYESVLTGDGLLALNVADGSFPLSDPTKPAYKALIDMKKSLRERGLLQYRDAYALALEYLNKHPCIRTTLRKRFPFVFVDEMQDMHSDQYELLEALFGEETQDSVVYQRIGDKDQAIYSGQDSSGDRWQDRSKVLPLSISLRLSPSTAATAQSFSLSGIAIDGTGGVGEGLKPHVIVYDDASVGDVIARFSGLVSGYAQGGCIPLDSGNPVKAVAWRKNSLKTFFPQYEESGNQVKVYYPNLLSYVVSGGIEAHNGHCIGPIHNRLAQALLHALFMEGVEIGRSVSGGTERRGTGFDRLIRYLSEVDKDAHELLLLKMWEWCSGVYCDRITEVHEDIIAYVPSILAIFGKTIDKCDQFVSSTSVSVAGAADTGSPLNLYKGSDGVDIQIGTVHSVKGETHTATLYLESSYYTKYETDYLGLRFKRKTQAIDSQRLRDCAKILYVGFTRPTHLLCYAIHQSRFDPAIFEGNWAIIDDLVH